MNDLLDVLSGTLAVALLVIGWLTIRDILRGGRGMTKAKAAAWVLIVVLVPPFGAIAYWVARTPRAA